MEKMKKENSGFKHSTKVPRLYKTASLILRQVVEEGASLKDLVYGKAHNIKATYALVIESIKHEKILDELFKKSKLFKKDPQLNEWLARILVTQAVIRQKPLAGNSKPVERIQNIQNELITILETGKGKFKQLKESIPQDSKKPRYVRVNTLKRSTDEVIKEFRKEGWVFCPGLSDYETHLKTVKNLTDNQFIRDYHIKEVLVFPPSAIFQLLQHSLLKESVIFIQDKASCLAPHLLNPSYGSTVLDMCAAPGNKTTQLAAMMRNKGQLYAIERNFKRFKLLRKFVSAAGCTNVATILDDSLHCSKYDSSKIEYILLDPTCSATGMSDQVAILKGGITPQRINKLSRFQFKLLMHSLTNFPNVKRVVYSTCSTEVQENEKVVQDVLNKLEEENKGKFKLVKALEETWPNRGSSEFVVGDSCLVAHAAKDLTNGFFIAVIDVLPGRKKRKSEEVKGKSKKLKIDQDANKMELGSNEAAVKRRNMRKLKKKQNKVAGKVSFKTHVVLVKKKKKSKGENITSKTSDVTLKDKKQMSPKVQNNVQKTPAQTNDVGLKKAIKNSPKTYSKTPKVQESFKKTKNPKVKNTQQVTLTSDVSLKSTKTELKNSMKKQMNDKMFHNSLKIIKYQKIVKTAL